MEEVTQVKKADSDKLLIVSIFHYVIAAFQMFFSLAGLIYITMGILIANGTMEASKTTTAPPVEMGWIFIVLGAILVTVFFTMSILTLKTGINISKRKHRTFCIVIDSILCLWVPFGTLVGIFGLVLLTKPEMALEFRG